jgi:diaminohydroxyphosphoribosylaminopyrimidine deaminase/5-amino-6-(5-phosphoribosylamino)uracil reductase
MFSNFYVRCNLFFTIIAVYFNFSDGNSRDQSHDKIFMNRAIDLAINAQGKTNPNPCVGCVIVDRDGNIVGEGYHHKAGEAHAEVLALNMAGNRSFGATAYVSLEPCNHHGRTPPCTNALIR